MGDRTSLSPTMFVQYYSKKDYAETRTGNKVARKAIISSPQNIKTVGTGIIMNGVVIRGDLAKVSFGKYFILKENTTLHPASKLFRE